MNEKDKTLLRKFLQGQCQDAELEQVARLLASKQNIEMLDQLMEGQAAANWIAPIDEEQATYTNKRLVRAHARIREIELSEVGKKTENRRFIKKNWLRYVAVFAGALLLSWLTYFQIKKNVPNQIDYQIVEKTNLKGIPVRYILPDRSEVYLGAGSTLAYPIAFHGDRREIHLKGEAFFTVTPMPHKPFTVQTDEVVTQVLGTSFKIEAFEGQPLSVAVATGKVTVSKKADKAKEELALLTPGQKITQNFQTGQFEKSITDISKLKSWKNGDLIFEKTLEDAVQLLQRRYGLTITIASPVIKQYSMIATFEAAESLEDVLELMSLVGKFRYEKDNENNYFLYTND